MTVHRADCVPEPQDLHADSVETDESGVRLEEDIFETDRFDEAGRAGFGKSRRPGVSLETT